MLIKQYSECSCADFADYFAAVYARPYRSLSEKSFQ